MDLGEVLRGKGTIFILSTAEIKVIKVLVSDGRTPIFIGMRKARVLLSSRRIGRCTSHSHRGVSWRHEVRYPASHRERSINPYGRCDSMGAMNRAMPSSRQGFQSMFNVVLGFVMATRLMSIDDWFQNTRMLSSREMAMLIVIILGFRC